MPWYQVHPEDWKSSEKPRVVTDITCNNYREHYVCETARSRNLDKKLNKQRKQTTSAVCTHQTKKHSEHRLGRGQSHQPGVSGQPHPSPKTILVQRQGLQSLPIYDHFFTLTTFIHVSTEIYLRDASAEEGKAGKWTWS